MTVIIETAQQAANRALMADQDRRRGNSPWGPVEARSVQRFCKIHDQRCRCRDCKPPLMGETPAQYRRRKMAEMIVLAVGAMIAFGAAIAFALAANI
jgi:hypothetical protein